MKISLRQQIGEGKDIYYFLQCPYSKRSDSINFTSPKRNFESTAQ